MKHTGVKPIFTSFLKELEDAKNGKKTSLPFIKHTLPSNPLVEEGDVFQVLVIGGTMFKKAMVKKLGESVKILSYEEKKQPIFDTKETLLSFIAGQLVTSAHVVAINFAFPMKPVFENGRLDGILLPGVKEHTFKGMIGRKLGKEVEEYAAKHLKRKITVSVANDTICLLLSGLTQFSWEKLAGGIVGTGVNFALFLEKDKVVNLEAGNFDKLPQSPQGKEIDKVSTNKGRHLFEKETSGAYLYRHFNSIIEQQDLDVSPLSSTFDLKKLAVEDASVSPLARKLLLYSAGLIAAEISGIAAFMKKQPHATTDSLVFIMEGSFFWGGNMYKNAVKQFVKELLPKQTITFVKIEDSPILGAAKLVS